MQLQKLKLGRSSSSGRPMEPIRHASVLDLLLGPQLKWGKHKQHIRHYIIRKKKSSCKISKQLARKILTSRSKPYNGPNSFNSLNILKHHRIQRKCHGFGYMTWHIATNSITTINLITNPKNIIRYLCNKLIIPKEKNQAEESQCLPGYCGHTSSCGS